MSKESRKLTDQIRQKKRRRQSGEDINTMKPFAIRSLGCVAAILGISRQAVHEVEQNAIYKIRLALKGWRQ